jgi:hypothetical protein
VNLPDTVIPSREVAKLGLFTPKVEEFKYLELTPLVPREPLTEDGQGESDVSMTVSNSTPRSVLMQVCIE